MNNFHGKVLKNSIIMFAFLWMGTMYANEEQTESSKRVHLNASFLGGLPSIQAGISVAYSLQPDLLIETQYHHNDFVFIPIVSKTTMLGLKKFWFNSSFYTDLMGGVVSTTFEKNLDKSPSGGESVAPSSKTYATVKGESWILGITIGNRWVFNNGFSLGCDWIAYGMPIAKKSRWKARNDHNGDPAQFAELEEDLKSRQLGGSVRLLTPHIGWSF